MIFYLIAINVVALTAMGIDKVRSMTDTKRRIPEKRLFLYVLLGGGFGGCTVSIVKDEAIEDFKKTVGENYKKKIGYDATFYTVEIGGGPQVC